jgi:hypothetical protein
MAANLAAPNWTALVTNSPANGTFPFTDPSATNRSRFYRAVKQQSGKQNTMSEAPNKTSTTTERNL